MCIHETSLQMRIDVDKFVKYSLVLQIFCCKVRRGVKYRLNRGKMYSKLELKSPTSKTHSIRIQGMVFPVSSKSLGQYTVAFF